MEKFRQYRRTQIAEMRPYVPGEAMQVSVTVSVEGYPVEKLVAISVSQPDRDAGSPKLGDMIARNPKNHEDQWLVAQKYFAENFEPMKLGKETSSRVSTIAAEVMNTYQSEEETVPATRFNLLLDKAQTLAGSAMSQDQTPGNEPVVASTPVDVGDDDNVVEAREIGGHDIDRDGPVKFES